MHEPNQPLDSTENQADDLPANTIPDDVTYPADATSMLQNATNLRQNTTDSLQNATSVAPHETELTSEEPTSCAQFGDPECDKYSNSLLRLTAIQEQAIALLAAGRPDAIVAKSLNVHRTTIHRWRTRHPRFIAELSYHARTARTDAALNTNAALELATRLVLKRLRSKPRKSMGLAMRLLTSARVAHLATPPHRPLRQVLNDLYRVRSANPESPFEDPVYDDLEGEQSMLKELATELAAPLPAAPAPATLPTTPSPKPRRISNLHRLRANRPPRSDLLAAMEVYDNKIPSDLAAIIARRPDLAPFDIHYVMNAPDYPEKKRPRLLTTLKPVGVTAPLSAEVIAELADDRLIGAIGGHDLEHYKLKYRCEDRVAYLDLHPYAPDKKIIAFHQDQLWRDLIIWPSQFTDEEANT